MPENWINSHIETNETEILDNNGVKIHDLLLDDGSTYDTALYPVLFSKSGSATLQNITTTPNSPAPWKVIADATKYFDRDDTTKRENLITAKVGAESFADYLNFENTLMDGWATRYGNTLTPTSPHDILITAQNGRALNTVAKEFAFSEIKPLLLMTAHAAKNMAGFHSVVGTVEFLDAGDNPVFTFVTSSEITGSVELYYKIGGGSDVLIPTSGVEFYSTDVSITNTGVSVVDFGSQDVVDIAVDMSTVVNCRAQFDLTVGTQTTPVASYFQLENRLRYTL